MALTKKNLIKRQKEIAYLALHCDEDIQPCIYEIEKLLLARLAARFFAYKEEWDKSNSKKVDGYSQIPLSNKNEKYEEEFLAVNLPLMMHFGIHSGELILIKAYMAKLNAKLALAQIRRVPPHKNTKISLITPSRIGQIFSNRTDKITKKLVQEMADDHYAKYNKTLREIDAQKLKTNDDRIEARKVFLRKKAEIKIVFLAFEKMLNQVNHFSSIPTYKKHKTSYNLFYRQVLRNYKHDLKIIKKKKGRN